MKVRARLLAWVFFGCGIVAACSEQASPTAVGDRDQVGGAPTVGASAGEGGHFESPSENPRLGGSSGEGGESDGVIGGGGAGGAGGAPASCDCGDDASRVRVALDCACEHGLCSTFASDLARYQSQNNWGEPYYVLLGTCAQGYRQLRYGEASEQSGTRTYDASGMMVFDQHGGYYSPPEVCGFDEDEGGLGTITIGSEDPAEACEYCLVVAHDPRTWGGGGEGGGGEGGAPFYEESLTPPCPPEELD